MFKIKTKKAFTIIELMVVIAVIGILVLMAAPKFIDRVEETKIVRIQNDIKVVEGKVMEEYIESNDIKKEMFAVNLNNVYGNIYNTRGKVEGYIEGKYKIVEKKIIYSAQTRLKGTFYSNARGGVYYVEEKMSTKDVKDVEFAKNEDFEWFTDINGYNNVNGEFGYYKYVGNSDTVKIPKKINGTLMTSYYKMFEGKLNTSSINIISNNKINNMNSMFLNSELEIINVSNLNTSNVQHMSCMFSGLQAKVVNGLNYFDTSEVIDMSWMFHNSELIVLNLDNFITLKVINMKAMFEGSKALFINIEDFDTSNVIDMSWMFRLNKLETLNLSNFDTSKVVDLTAMFAGAEIKTLLGLKNFNTSNVTNMSSMFYYSKINNLDLSNFDTSNVIMMKEMFAGSKATKINISSFNTFNVIDMSYMFGGVRIPELNLNNFETGQVTNMTGMFGNAAINSLNLSSFNIKNSIMTDIFTGSEIKNCYINQESEVKFKSIENNNPKDINFVLI